jgi:hypothetical protein
MAQLGAAFWRKFAAIVGDWFRSFRFSGDCLYEPYRRGDGRKRLVQKRLDSGELIAPFGDMALKCHQHYTFPRYLADNGRKLRPLSSGYSRMLNKLGLTANIFYAFALHVK